MVHREIMVKVNAPVDAGVASLVSALSEDTAIETIESCEGRSDKPAYVIFRTGAWRQCGEFLFDRLLPAMDPDLRADVAVSIESYDQADCHGRISLSPEAVGRLAELVRNVRKSGCSGGKKHTSLSSC